MEIALAEARKGIGKTAPNPPVGAVIVKDGKILGKGWHTKAGQPHAEVEALRNCGDRDTLGATAYVTLEPCSTTGRTPACTSALAAAGISRVVYACEDPNPSHAGGADAILREAGIEVLPGILRNACAEILRPFSKVQRTGLPWVIWKCAMSLDGKITRPAGEGQWLSGADSRMDVQKLRSEVDAILTSGETVRRDNPALTIRVPELLEGRLQPWRVIATNRPETMPREAPLFSDEWKDRTLISPKGDLAGLLRDLVANQGVLSVMIEAGGKFAGAMLSAGLVDEAVIYHSVAILGANGAGKSSLLKLITGEVRPAFGATCRLFGEERWCLEEIRHQLGLVMPEDVARFHPAEISSDVVLSAFRAAYGRTRDMTFTPDEELRSARAIEELGIGNLSDRDFGQLSSGEKRRFLIARALVHRPEVLILDEPSTALDFAARLAILDKLRELAGRSTTLLLVTHDPAEILPEIERVILLKEGRIIADGRKEDILHSASLSELFGMPLKLSWLDDWAIVKKA
eukprot:g3607.t1